MEDQLYIIGSDIELMVSVYETIAIALSSLPS